YKYEAPFTDSAGNLAKQLFGSGIQALVRVHDPCTAVSADLGPSRSIKNAVRLENLLQTGPDKLPIVVATQNERIAECDWSFGYQPFDEQRLHKLQETCDFDSLLADATSELNKLVRLRNWSRGRFR